MRVGKVFAVILFFMLAFSQVWAEDGVGSYSQILNKITKDIDKEEKKELIIKIFKSIISTDSFKALDEDDKQGLLEYLEEENILNNFNRNAFTELLDGDFSEKDKVALLNIFPDIHAGIPKVSTQELIDLANMTHEDIENAINNYLKTGKIEKKYEFIISPELIAIIKEKNEIIKEKNEIIKEKNEIIKRGEEADRRGEEADKRSEEYRKQIKKIRELNKKFDNIIKGIKFSLEKGGVKH